MNYEELHQSTFHFKGWEKEKNSNVFAFSYAVQTEKQLFTYTETLEFPAEITIDVNDTTTAYILDQLTIGLGISYYKGFLSKNIDLHHAPLSNDEVAYWNTVYTKGLGELLLRNKLDKSLIATFPVTESSDKDAKVNTPTLSTKKLKEESMLGFGGGKDTYVSFEELKKSETPATFFLIETNKTYNALRKDIQELNLQCVFVKRTIDPKFIGDIKMLSLINGHIPISAIYSWIGILIAYTTDRKYVSLGNESSAEEGTTGEVNHQWSKTTEHENILSEMVHEHIHPEMNFFSPIRKFSSIKVAKTLCEYPQYLDYFTSCSKQFNQQNTNEKRWCNECAKCLGTFILLAPWIGVQKTTEIYGENLLKKESLRPILDELTGKALTKPFECVATIDETNACLEATNKNDTSILEKYIHE
ncbi:MAG: hypothetical protein RLY57_154 [Candidatus Parcubacteria bacterium]|jgi:hypothetical protein